jgi:hypothetical protein
VQVGLARHAHALQYSLCTKFCPTKT